LYTVETDMYLTAQRHNILFMKANAKLQCKTYRTAVKYKTFRDYLWPEGKKKWEFRGGPWTHTVAS